MEWHRRLDQEEAEVLQLERILLDYNNVHVQQQNQHQNEIVAVAAVQERNPNQSKMEKKLKDIDRSLRELSSISGADGSTDAGGVGSGDFVRTSGAKLNKLWRRLTSQRTEKFQPNKRYKLCKADVEQLYEDAKLAVLHEFGENAGQMEVFLGQTSIISTPQPSNVSMDIPQLNLNFSSGQSEEDSMMRGNYSPSAAEEGYVMPSTSSQDGLSEASSSKRRATSRNSSSSAMQSMSECYSSTNVQGKMENAQKIEDMLITSNLLRTTKPKDSKTDFSNKSANVSNISINYVLSSKTDCNKRVLEADSMQNNRSDKSQGLESSIKNESVPNKDSNSKTDNEMIEISNSNEIRSLSSKIEKRSKQINKNDNTAMSLVSKSDIIKENETESRFQIQSGDPALTRNSTNAMGYSSDTIESIEDLTSPIPELSNSSSSKTSKTIESLSNQIQNSTIHSLSDISRSIDPEIQTICSSYSGETKTTSDQISKSVDTKVPESISTESDLLSLLKTSTEIDSALAKSISKNSKISSENEPISQINQSENVSNIETPTESLKASSRSIKSPSLIDIIKTSSSKDISPIPDFDSNIKPEPEIKEKLVGTKSLTSNTDEVVRKVSSASNASSKSSEECASVSILKSLLNSTYNSNSIFASNQASNTASDIQTQLRTNGHDFQSWSNTLIQTKEDTASFKDDQSIATQISRTEPSLSYPDETTLRSIKSIDNSTNSKHSTDPVSNPTNIATNAEGEEDEYIHSNQNLDSKSEDIHHQSYSSAFEDSSAVSSNQIRSSVIMSIKSPSFQVEVEAEAEPLTNAFYESDFTEGEETNIDDISLPKFETTAEEEQFNETLPSQPAVTDTTDFENRLIDLDVSLKDLDATFEKALSPEKTLSTTRDDENKRSQEQNDSALMPDIISEVELRRRHQAMLENELKQFEHAVPYMYVREIPNKPPPPYVPPAHGSPMTTIFPSEERIKDITFRRTKELYCEILNTDTEDELGKKPPSVLDENITNIYERIILDICKEYLNEYKPILSSADPNNFHSSLAFFNPPDRLQCMQQFIYKEIRKNLAMDKNGPEKNQLYSVYGHRGKRDHIGEIIIQEMYEEDDIWSNFYVEEEEVLELIIEEIVSAKVRDICTEILEDETPRDSITPTPDADERVEMCCNNST